MRRDLSSNDRKAMAIIKLLRPFISFILLLFCLCGIVIAQQLKSYYINPTKPSIYVTFFKVGSLAPLKLEESRNRIWLVLHNNTIWNLRIPVYGVPEAYGDCGLFFEVVPSTQIWIPTTIQKNAVQWPPAFENYRLSTGYSTDSLKPGKTLVFSVPSETLQDGFAIRIPYNYEWENQQGVAGRREPVHFVIFSRSDIPKTKD
jgi:hypothetical protein